MLMGVTSNRVDVKRQGALAERELERRAEPLAALFQAPEEYPERLLELAWREMVRNSAHDSICACSVDDVVDAVLHRYAEARHDRRRAGRPGGEGIRPVAGRARSLGAQPVAPRPLRRRRARGAGRRPGAGERPGALRAVRAARIDGARRRHRAHRARHAAGAEDQRRRLDPRHPHRGHRGGDRHHHLRRHRGEARRAHRRGQAGRLHPARGAARRRGAGRHGPAVDAEDRRPFRRGARLRLVRLRSRPRWPTRSRSSEADGSVALDQRSGAGGGRPGRAAPSRSTASRGYGRLVDGGDLGDSYNYSPPRQDSFVDTPESVTVRVDERGPVRARVRITATYAWPDHVDGSSQARVGRASGRGRHRRRAAGGRRRWCGSRTTFVNPSGDHRLRVHLPLPEPARESQAESAFAVVTRGLTAEGRPDELGLPTAPSQRFVTRRAPHRGPRGRLRVRARRRGGRRGPHAGAHRPALDRHAVPARHGLPALPRRTAHARSRGCRCAGKRVSLRYALALGLRRPLPAGRRRPAPARGRRRAWAAARARPSGSELAVARRRGRARSTASRGVLEVRVFNPTDQPAVVSFPGRSGWLVDLRGYPREPFEGSFELRPFGIATARLRDRLSRRPGWR